MSGQSRDSRRWRLGVLVSAIALGGGWLLGATILDHYGARHTDADRADAIVVLGAGVLQSGKASPPLARRTLRAVELWKAGVAPVIVMTGGLGPHPPSQALVSRALAIENGVPPSAILVEATSHNTWENARNASKVSGAKRVVIVTDAFHIYRATAMFEQHFEAVAAVGVVARPYNRARGALREVISVTYYTARGII